MATEQLSYSWVIPVGISVQIVIQELYDSCVSDCGSHSRVMSNSVETNVCLSQLS